MHSSYSSTTMDTCWPLEKGTVYKIHFVQQLCEDNEGGQQFSHVTAETIQWAMEGGWVSMDGEGESKAL